jgi:hypothetical protein
LIIGGLEMKAYKKKLVFLILILVAVLLLAGCQTRISDSGFSQKTMGKKIDSNIYVLNVTMLGDVISNKDMSAEAASRQYSDIYGYGNMRLWQDGKGLVLVHVNSISPNLSYVKPGTDIVLKTTDLKIMAITEGYQFEVKCRSDYEPVASLENNEMTNDRYDTHELDFCRMTTPEITISDGGEG